MNATHVAAEIPEMDPARMREIASHVFVGKIARIYSSAEKEPSADSDAAHSIAEIKVTKVEKGRHEATLAYVRFTNRHAVIGAQTPSGSTGQRSIPKVGAMTRVFVITGDDGGFDVLPPNGFAEVTEKQPK